MARIVQKSKIGHLNGKVGDLVVTDWNEISYVRNLPKKSKRPRTQAQLEQQARFALLNSFMKKLTPYVRIGFKDFAERKTALNVAVSINAQSLITGEYPDFNIDITQLKLSIGGLSAPQETTLESYSDGLITLGWKTGTIRKGAQPDDELLVCVIENVSKDVETDIRVAKRSDGTYTMDLSTDYSTETVHVFGSFVSKDGNLVSDSVYFGSVTVM